MKNTIKVLAIISIICFLVVSVCTCGSEYYGSNVPLFRRNGYRQSGTMIS